MGRFVRVDAHGKTCVSLWCGVSSQLSVQGPKDTPYEGGTFEVLLNVPEQYPLMPPAVRYRTKIFHPNVHFKVDSKVHQSRVVSFGNQWLL